MRKLFLVILLIFGLVAVWIYSGRPQIWQNPPIPPEIQEASASDTTKTYAFATDSEGWTGTGGADTTNSYQSGAGNPAGSIQSRILGRNKKDSAAGWYISGITWENLGVPAGATVNNVDGKYDWRCSEYTTGASSASGDLTATDSTDGNSTTLETRVTFTATTAWATRNATGAVSMPSALQPSNTSIKIKLLGDLNTGNDAAAAVTRQMDTIVLIITYTAAPSLTFSVEPSTVTFPELTPGSLVATTSRLEVKTDNSSGFYITVARDDADTTMDLDTDASVNITDKTNWSAPAATTTAGNATASTTEPLTLQFRIRQSGTDVPNYASSWWGSDDSTANALFAGFPSTAQKIIIRSTAATASTTAYVLYNLDVPSTQKTGTYSGGITYTATANP